METIATTEKLTDDDTGTASTDHSPLKLEPTKPAGLQPRPAIPVRRSQRAKKQAPAEKSRGQWEKRRVHRGKRQSQEEKKEGVTVKRTTGGKRRWDKKHYCVFCRRPQVKIARHLLRKHAEEQDVLAASVLPTGSKERHLLLEQLRCKGNYLHNIEVIRQDSGEIVPWRQPSEEVDARNYLPCPLCLGFFLRADLWKHQVSCRKKLSHVQLKDCPTALKPELSLYTDTAVKSYTGHAIDQTVNSSLDLPPLPSEDIGTEDNVVADTPGTKRPGTPGKKQPRKRFRVQAAASRLLPISSGASESCSEVLHRMNQDVVSHQVKSDWLICKYGNKLMGNQDCRKYDYISQKLRKLGRFLLAAKSLNSGIQSLQDLLDPGQLSLVLSAARKASDYRWSRPPLAVKTTLKTVCEIAIGECLQNGNWEAAAKTTNFYHLLGNDWDNLCQLTPEVEKGAPRKIHKRPWFTTEKEAIWRQLAGHVQMQTVPGKEMCLHCLALEPVLQGRHWKDIKNQVHNQIQCQKKQQHHAHDHMTQHKDTSQQYLPQNHNHSKRLNQAQMDQQNQESIHNHKKQVYQAQTEPQEEHMAIHKLFFNHLDQHSTRNESGQRHFKPCSL